MPTRIDTLIVGAGQAGLALSHYLAGAGHEHVLLERGRIGQRWHERWDSLTLLSPNWMNRLPGGAAHTDPDGFLDRLGLIDYLDDYARSFSAPVVEGVEVERVGRSPSGFRVETSAGPWIARNVVVATGDADVPHVPFPAPHGVPAVHASEYRRSGSLPDGRVLVVGAGASGQQLALELRTAGRDVVLSAGRHSRSPRRYRGRDIFEWLQLLGDFDRLIDELPDLEAAKRVPLFPLSGANGGDDLGLDVLDSLGIEVVGRLSGFDGRRGRLRRRPGRKHREGGRPPGEDAAPHRLTPAGRRGPCRACRSPCPSRRAALARCSRARARSSGRPATSAPILGSASPVPSIGPASSRSGRGASASPGSTSSGSPTSTGATPTSSAGSGATPSSLPARSSPGQGRVAVV